MAYSLLYCSKLTEDFPAMLYEFIEHYSVDLFFQVFLPQGDIDVKYNALGVSCLKFKEIFNVFGENLIV